MRAVFFFAAMVVFLGFFVFMAALEVETENADTLVKELDQIIMDLDGNGIFTHDAFLIADVHTWSWMELCLHPYRMPGIASAMPKMHYVEYSVSIQIHHHLTKLFD